MEEYPIFSWMNRVSENAHQKARENFLKSADQFGNKVYNQDIPIVSSFTGGLFHASAMNNDKGKSNTASVTGSFLNGFLGIGILGTVDGLVGAVADPFTALEGINQFFYEPEKSVPVFRSYVISELNKKFIHGSAEEKSRVAGAITFEVVTAVLGELAAAKVGDQAGDAGKTAKILDQVEDMDDAADASKAAEQIVQIDKAEDVLDSASDMEKAEDILDQAADAEKAGRVAGTAKSFQMSVAEYVKKLLSSDKVGEAAEKADDIVNAVRRRLNSSGSEWEPALATGQLDDVDDFDLFSRKYNEYIKEKQSMNTGGVKINKIEGGGGGRINNPKEVNIHGRINTELDEIDLANNIIYEDKTAGKLYMNNPDCPLTEEQWAFKHIFRKGRNRILALQQDDFTLSGKGILPDVESLKKIRKYVFRIDADTTALRIAVEKELENLRKIFPGYDISAVYGGKK